MLRLAGCPRQHVNKTTRAGGNLGGGLEWLNLDQHRLCTGGISISQSRISKIYLAR